MGKHTKQARGTTLASLAGLLITLAGCTSFWVSAPTTPTPTCAELHLCWTITPFCGPAVTPTPQPGLDISYQSAYWPQNLAALVGFQPLLPAGKPQDDLEWNKVILVGSSSQPAQPALLHIGYESWSRASESRSLGPGILSLLTIEETTGALDPLSRLELGAPPSYIAQQYPTTVGGEAATVYHIANQAARTGTYQTIEILWHVGPLTVRLLAAGTGLSGAFQVDDPGDPRLLLDEITSGRIPPRDVDAFWLGVAASVAPFTGCG